ncbi:TPA: ATPase [Streptococcus pneumoniae]
MNKKKMILTSLASVAILGAGFVASQPTVVRAEEAPVASQSKAEKDYDAAKRDAENAKKALEEAKRAQKKYEDDQKKTEEKAKEEKQASEAEQKANLKYQLLLQKYVSESDGKKKKEIEKQADAAKKENEIKKAELNKIRQEIVVPSSQQLEVTKRSCSSSQNR